MSRGEELIKNAQQVADSCARTEHEDTTHYLIGALKQTIYMLAKENELLKNRLRIYDPREY